MRPSATTAFCLGLTLTMSELGVAAAVVDPSGEATRRAAEWWGRTMCDRCGVRIVAHGLDRVDWSRPMVFMANHQSHFDVPVLYASLPRVLGMLAKHELFRIPAFGAVMSALGCVPIDRGDPEQSRASLERAAARVRGGSSIVVFPEGTRATEPRVKPLKKGPFWLAEAARTPVVPIGIRGTRHVLPKHAWTVRPGDVEVHVGEPIVPGRGADGRERTRADVHAALVALSGLSAT